MRRTYLRGVDHDLFMILRRSNPQPIKYSPWITETHPPIQIMRLSCEQHVGCGLLRATAHATASARKPGCPAFARSGHDLVVTNDEAIPSL